jgi:hypothetical protein
MAEEASKLGLYSKNLGFNKESSSVYRAKWRFLSYILHILESGSINLYGVSIIRLKSSILIISAYILIICSLLNAFAAKYTKSFT